MTLYHASHAHLLLRVLNPNVSFEMIYSFTDRHYEERELRAQQERARKRMEFENLRHKLENQLECERSQDTEG